MEYPEVLYKYTSSESAVKILQNCTMKLTPPVDFDDPFEFEPGKPTRPDPGTPNFKKYMLPTIKKRTYYNSFCKNTGFEDNYQSYINKINSDLLFVSEVSEIGEKQGFLLSAKKIPKIKSDLFGIFCLSEVCNDILMWSHYADGHKGVCIGFKVKKLLAEPLKDNIKKVIYSSERVSIPHGVSQEEGEKAVDKLVRTKSTHWLYEKEWRFSCLLKENSLEKKDGNNNKGAIFYPFENGEDAIAEVILGCEICTCRKAIIIKRIQEINAKRSNNNEPVKLVQAKVHDSEFKLDLKEIQKR